MNSLKKRMIDSCNENKGSCDYKIGDRVTISGYPERHYVIKEIFIPTGNCSLDGVGDIAKIKDYWAESESLILMQEE